MDRFKDRSSRGVFTETHIAMLTNLPMMLEAETQTEKYEEEKKLRFKIKTKTGTDIGVQVIENKLFNFDKESEGIVKVLVSNIIEEARMEALDEDEKEYMCNRQLYYNKMENNRVKKMRQFEKLEVQKRERARQKKRESKRNKEVALNTQAKLLSREVSKRYFQVIKQDLEIKRKTQMMSKQDWAQEEIQRKILREVEGRVYQNLSMRSELQKLLKKIGSEVKLEFLNFYIKSKKISKW